MSSYMEELAARAAVIVITSKPVRQGVLFEPATSRKHISNPRLLSYWAADDVASIIW